VAVLDGSLGCVQGVLDSVDPECSQQQLDEALELAAMLGRRQMLQLLLKNGASVTAAALTWAEQRHREPKVLATLHVGLTSLRRRRGRSSSSSSSSRRRRDGSSISCVGYLSVAACAGGCRMSCQG
jgi:hypothetical protein